MKFSTGAMLSGLAMASAMPAPQHPKGPSPIPGKWFDRFVIVVMENTNKATALANSYYHQLTKEGILLNGYQGTTHPSQPNYISMISSTIAGGVFDDADHTTSQNSLVDLFDPAGITWKAYMEGYSPLAGGACNPINKDHQTLYVRKHNPFISFDNIRNNITRCQNIVKAEDHFAQDVAKGRNAPQYMFYTPNLKNDAHDTDVAYTVKVLRQLVDTMRSNKEFMKNTLILITFDENDVYDEPSYGTPNDVYTVLLGDDVVSCKGCVDQQFYNHFTQLTTIEKNWNLTNIPNPDGDGAQWDSWMLPFSHLKTKGSHEGYGQE